MLQDLRDRVVAGDEDEGEGLVVPEHHVEAGLEPLDEVRLEQQRLDLGRGGDELHARGVRDHAGNSVVVPGTPRVALHALLEVPRLAHIEHLAVRIEHAVDAGTRGRRLGVAGDHGRACFGAQQSLAGARNDRGGGAVGVF